MSWSDGEKERFIELLLSLWPTVLPSDSEEGRSQVLALWFGSLQSYPQQDAAAAVRRIYSEQEIRRAPALKTVVDLARSNAEERGHKRITYCGIAPSVFAMLEPGVRELYRQKHAARQDPDISWQEFKRRVVNRETEVADLEAMEFVAGVFERGLKREKVLRGGKNPSGEWVA